MLKTTSWPPPTVQQGRLGLLKASFDRASAICGLVALLPLLGAVALAIRLEGHGPALFVQLRPGLGGRPFRLVKFRTMRAAVGPDDRSLPDAKRLTPLGRWLRRSSLDELPQLWNVLCGQLSLVGPRPLLMEYLSRYSPEQGRRHLVKPGITGWAQINGRNALSWDDKFTLDCWYVDHWSLFLDFKILLKTVLSVLSGRGVSAPGHATAEEFRGSMTNGGRHV